MQFASTRVQRPVELRWQDRSFSWPRPAPKPDLGAEAKKVRFWSLLRGGILKGKWRAKRSFRPRRSSKTESWRCEEEAFVRDFPKKQQVEDVKTKLSFETSLQNWKWKLWTRDFSSEMSFKNGQLKSWKPSFCARLPFETDSWRCENEAFVRDIPQKLRSEDMRTSKNFSSSSNSSSSSSSSSIVSNNCLMYLLKQIENDDFSYFFLLLLLLLLLLLRLLKRHLPDGKTPWQWRKEKGKKSAQKLPNVPSEIRLKLQFSRLFLTFWTNLRPAKRKSVKIAPKNSLMQHLKPIEKDDFSYFFLLLLLLLLLKRYLPDGKAPWQGRTEKHQNCVQKLPHVTSETDRKWWF